jgi:nicotinamide mononucleotide (NMN) deamidase PncC
MSVNWRDAYWAAKACNLTFATAESCTAGAIAFALSASPPAEDLFHGGVVAYTKRMKEEMLGVPHDLLRDKSCSCLPRPPLECFSDALELCRLP